MDEIGVIHGRFQVLHNDHMKYLLAGKERCRHLIIGICNPEVELTRYTSANPHRSKKSANPMTYYERFICIRDALIEAGIPQDEFDIVPFPVNYPDHIFNYVPMNARFYMTIYDQWGHEKYEMFRNELNLDVQVMWEVSIEDKGISASDIRDAILEGEPWDHLVPPSVYRYITENHIDDRIAEFLGEERMVE